MSHSDDCDGDSLSQCHSQMIYNYLRSVSIFFELL